MALRRSKMTELRPVSRPDAFDLALWKGLRPAAADIAILMGLLILALPVLIDLAREEWITEQGSQGPIMFALGLWLLAREWPGGAAVRAEGWRAPAGLALILPAYVFSRVTGQLWLSWMCVMAAGALAIAARSGFARVRDLWFPLLFLILLVPPPGLLAGPLTDWLNLTLASLAVAVFRIFGTDAASGGAMIYLGPYEMQLIDACAGMGSLLSLFAMGMLYIRLRHRSNWRYALAMAPFIVIAAIVANFARIVLLLLVTLVFGDGAAQGWFHPMAGLILFTLALLAVIGLDAILAPLRVRLDRAEVR